MQLKDVMSVKFTDSINRISLRSDARFVWVKFQLKNATLNQKELYLHNTLGFQYKNLKFFALKDNKIIDSKEIDLLNFQGDTETIKGTDSLFLINLQPNETQTIYLQLESFSLLYFELLLFDSDNSVNHLINSNIFIVLIIGFFIALTAYNLLLGFTTRYSEYIYYSLYLLSSTIWLGFEYGAISRYFQIYGMEAYILSFGVMFAMIFLSLFIKTVLETKNKYTLENHLLNSIIALFIIDILYGFINPFDALEVASLFMVYALIIFLFVSLNIYKKGNVFVKYILYAQMFFIFFSAIAILFYEGLVGYYIFTRYSAGFGIILEALILGYLLSFRIKSLKNENIQKDKTILLQSKFTAMGEMIENIAHQWRQPLSQVNSAVLVIDGELNQNRTMNKLVEEKLLEIETQTQYMSKTIDDIQHFYNPNIELEYFDLMEPIHSTIDILSPSLNSYHITVHFDISENIKISGYQNNLQQVFAIIINNAKDALIANNIQSPTINISAKKVHEKVIINICDNGGGIKKEILESIFEPYFTTKYKTQGTGLGLYISKMLIEDSMNGSISVQNSDKGACFTISI